MTTKFDPDIAGLVEETLSEARRLVEKLATALASQSERGESEVKQERIERALMHLSRAQRTLEHDEK